MLILSFLFSFCRFGASSCLIVIVDSLVACVAGARKKWMGASAGCSSLGSGHIVGDIVGDKGFLARFSRSFSLEPTNMQ